MCLKPPVRLCVAELTCWISDYSRRLEIDYITIILPARGN